LFEVISTTVPDATSNASFGIHVQTQTTPYVVYYSLENPEQVQIWDANIFKNQRIHYEHIVGPAVVILPHPEAGWVMFAVIPPQRGGMVLFLEGRGYIYTGDESSWGLIGGFRFSQGISLDSVISLVRTTVAKDLNLCNRSISFQQGLELEKK
jgi:hypothetical protein